MGVCFSCCRRVRSQEREPLLPKDRDRDIAPTRSQFDRFADAFAALKTGKLPSQDQVNRALQELLTSSVLDPTHVGGRQDTLSENGREIIEDVRLTIEALLRIGLEKNSDDKLQDFLFQCENIDSEPVHADVAIGSNGTSEMGAVAKELPTAQEAQMDAKLLLRSLSTLGRMLLTSSTFRLILSDVLRTARDVVADVAADVGQVASHIEKAAENVEEVARPNGGTLQDLEAKAKEAGAGVITEVDLDAKSRWEQSTKEHPGRVKEAVVARLQEVMLQAHKVPAYQDALQAILYLLRKYSWKVSQSIVALSEVQAPAITPIVWVEPPVINALSDLKTLLERFASGHSLDSFLQTLSIVISDIMTVPAEMTADSDAKREFRAYFTSVGAWLDGSLKDYQYVTSPSGQHDAEVLYERAVALTETAKESDAEWLQHIRSLLRELDDFVAALKSDRATNRVILALDTLSSHIAQFGSAAADAAPAEAKKAQRRWRKRIQRDVIAWVIPRLLQVVNAIPMPRVEYVSKTFDAAIDALLLTPSGLSSSAAASLVPDRIRIANYSELQIQLVEYEGGDGLLPEYSRGATQAYSRVRVHVDGIRVSARDIAYYMRYKGWRGLVGYEDQGLVSVEIGESQARGRGLSLEVEIELEGDSDGVAFLERTGGEAAEEVKSLFRITDVRVDIPGVHFSIDRSRHRILNKLFLEPLSAPVARTVVSYVLSQQIRTSLEALGKFAARVKRSAEETHIKDEVSQSPSFEDYWTAILQNISGSRSGDDDLQSNTEDDMHVETHTTTTTTLKGIIRNSTTQLSTAPSFSASTSPSRTSLTPPADSETSVLAIGIAPQILPGKGGPVDGPEAKQGSEYDARDVARDALDEVQGQVERTEERLEEAVGAAVEVREGVEDALQRETTTERVERRRAGWRSRAFDL